MIYRQQVPGYVPNCTPYADTHTSHNSTTLTPAQILARGHTPYNWESFGAWNERLLQIAYNEVGFSKTEHLALDLDFMFDIAGTCRCV